MTLYKMTRRHFRSRGRVKQCDFEVVLLILKVFASLSNCESVMCYIAFVISMSD